MGRLQEWEMVRRLRGLIMIDRFDDLCHFLCSWIYNHDTTVQSPGGALSVRCCKLLVGWRETLSSADPPPLINSTHGSRTAGGGSGRYKAPAVPVKQIHELKLEELLRSDKTTVLQRHPLIRSARPARISLAFCMISVFTFSVLPHAWTRTLSRCDRVLEVLYEEPYVASTAAQSSDRLKYLEVPECVHGWEVDWSVKPYRVSK